MSNGGPAFPIIGGIVFSEGLSIRDYFAAHAPSQSDVQLSAELRVRQAYEYADAMMAEREKVRTE